MGDVTDKIGFQSKNTVCPCRKKCPLHGECNVCRERHMLSKRKRPVHCDRKIAIRRFRRGEETAVSEVIKTTLFVSNKADYPPEFIEENIASHSAEVIAERARTSHFYVATDGRKIIGCGGITGYWGSTEESYILSVFVLPEYQKRGVGRRIIAALESDEYFHRAWRTEVGASVTAVGFYERMGYKFKNGTSADGDGVVRMEKRKET